MVMFADGRWILYSSFLVQEKWVETKTNKSFREFIVSIEEKLCGLTLNQKGVIARHESMFLR